MPNNQLRGGGTPNLILLSEAVTMTTDYRANKDSLLAKGIDKGVLPICETFDRAAFDVILGQTDCVAVRVYIGMDEKQNLKLIAVGVNSDGDDIISDEENSLIVDKGDRCPVVCPQPSVLNS